MFYIFNLQGFSTWNEQKRNQASQKSFDSLFISASNDEYVLFQTSTRIKADAVKMSRVTDLDDSFERTDDSIWLNNSDLWWFYLNAMFK